MAFAVFHRDSFRQLRTEFGIFPCYVAAGGGLEIFAQQASPTTAAHRPLELTDRYASTHSDSLAVHTHGGRT